MANSLLDPCWCTVLSEPDLGGIQGSGPFTGWGRGLGAHKFDWCEMTLSPGLYGTGSEGRHPQRSQPSQAGAVSQEAALFFTPRAQCPPRVPERQVPLTLQPERGACPPWAGPRQPYGVAFTGTVSPCPLLLSHVHEHTQTHTHTRDQTQAY